MECIAPPHECHSVTRSFALSGAPLDGHVCVLSTAAGLAARRRADEDPQGSGQLAHVETEEGAVAQVGPSKHGQLSAHLFRRGQRVCTEVNMCLTS